jgi:hypothetical protein
MIGRKPGRLRAKREQRGNAADEVGFGTLRSVANSVVARSRALGMASPNREHRPIGGGLEQEANLVGGEPTRGADRQLPAALPRRSR